jgi:transcriptional regulator with XRE-family HTH domain
MFDHERVKREMKQKGWSYRSAAAHVGKSYQWICLVLNGKATSKPVLKAISRLPVRSKAKPSQASV